MNSKSESRISDLTPAETAFADAAAKLVTEVHDKIEALRESMAVDMASHLMLSLHRPEEPVDAKR